MSTILSAVDTVKYLFSKEIIGMHLITEGGMHNWPFEYFQCGLLIVKAVVFGALLVPKFIFLLKYYSSFIFKMFWSAQSKCMAKSLETDISFLRKENESTVS